VVFVLFLEIKNFHLLKLIDTHTIFLQGLILSNALRAQKDAEDEGCVMDLSNLRSEVIELRNEGLEKAEAQKREIEDLRKQLARAKEERTLEETK
jgi:hypothetical protein